MIVVLVGTGGSTSIIDPIAGNMNLDSPQG